MAATPKNTLVMATGLDDMITLDPAEIFEFTGEAGLEDGFTVTMDTRNSEPVASMAVAIQGTLAQAGIKLEIIPGESKQTLTKYLARKHDIYIGTWGRTTWIHTPMQTPSHAIRTTRMTPNRSR